MDIRLCRSCKCLTMVGPENYVCNDWGINVENVPEDGCMGYSCKDNIVTAKIDNHSKLVTAVDVDNVLLLDGDKYFTVKEYVKLLINGGDTE